jgi:hypothetical protein
MCERLSFVWGSSGRRFKSCQPDHKKWPSDLLVYVSSRWHICFDRIRNCHGLPGRLCSGDSLPLTPGYQLGEEIAVVPG